MSGRVQFGDFVLDVDSRELRCGDTPVPLSPKAFQLLDALVASRPKALSKMALQERLWPDTFVVEKNLVNLIGEIREALGESSAHPRFVRTVHRFRLRVPGAGRAAVRQHTVCRSEGPLPTGLGRGSRRH
jgi:DNA-binding winged helix-turn-helix (wHTH) protein